MSQYVCAKLFAKLPPGYPDVSPTVILRNPRGLHEDHVRQIELEAEAKCEECVGQPIMFELIQVIMELSEGFFFKLSLVLIIGIIDA